MLRTLILVASLTISACTTLHPAPLQPQPAKGVVSAADPRAAEAGAEILRRGGSAADAAIATLLALNVVEPQSSGIGGGGFLVYAPRGRAATTIDGRETAPMAASERWFYDGGMPLTMNAVVPGGKGVGVPGNVRLMALAHQKYGRLAWASLFGPAIRLASDGFEVTPRMHRFLPEHRASASFSAAGRTLYYNPDGSPKAVGTVIHNPALAAYMAQLAKLGPDSFYVGPN
ncbi:MAG: gamma-glutamyltransferase, partial [Thermoflexales bacterium]